MFYPASYRRPYQIVDPDPTSVLQRTEVIDALGKQRKKLIVVTYPEAIVEKVIDFTGIRDEVLQTPDIDVMNGIAYNNGKLFVTGKNWDKIFEVEVYSKK